MGCLRCSQNADECLLCDFQTFYFYNSISRMCMLSPVIDCQLAFTRTTCLLCTNNSHPNSRGDCEKNSEENSINNCKLYFDVKRCAQCNDNYYLSNNSTQCLEISTQINNCEIFEERGCKICQSGYKIIESASNLFTCESKNIFII